MKRFPLALVLLFSTAAVAAPVKLRARALGIPFGGTPGPANAITDVKGVLVGHETIIEGNARTGVTAILPVGRERGRSPFAGYFSMNGNGELTGTNWLEDSGTLEGPIVFTNTHSVGVARDAVVKWSLDKKLWKTNPKAAYDKTVSLPVVGETWDGDLNDINGFHVTEAHVHRALDGAATGPVAEGNVGGGTGMVCFEFKCGIGTASRQVTVAGHRYVVGVLSQVNFGLREQLVVAGVPVGLALPIQPPAAAKKKESGSILIAVATDAPLLPHQLKRLARRAAMGLARTGSISGNGSGDLFLAFSTAHPGKMGEKGLRSVTLVPNGELDPLFGGTVEAVEESIVNALVAGETMTGHNGTTIEAIPKDRLKAILEKHGRLMR